MEKNRLKPKERRKNLIIMEKTEKGFQKFNKEKNEKKKLKKKEKKKQGKKKNN